MVIPPERVHRRNLVRRSEAEVMSDSSQKKLKRDPSLLDFEQGAKFNRAAWAHVKLEKGLRSRYWRPRRGMASWCATASHPWHPGSSAP